MSRSRHIDTITDYLIIAISPALVMLMVGSLVYFAINCFYAGNFETRLYIATALFVFATVLVSRISIESGREYASMFALPLSVTTILSMLKYTDASMLFLLPLVAFIWWSTDKLTWDCTVVDAQKDASGEGLLQTVGMDSSAEEQSHVQDHLDAEATTAKESAEELSLWQRWVARRRRNHTPGVWVIYFGIAAIPIFGFGQMLLPPTQRGPSFLLLCIYVASALALLMTTSFLQMRRYLNQRRLPFTDQMAGVWLSTGGVLIVGLMLFCLLLPRPNTGFSFVDSFEKIGSRDQKASKYSVGRQDAVQDEQGGSGESDRETAKSDADDGRQTSKESERGARPGDQAKAQGERKSKGSESAENSSKKGKSERDGAEQRSESTKSDESRESDRSSRSENESSNERDDRNQANDDTPNEASEPSKQRRQDGGDDENRGRNGQNDAEEQSENESNKQDRSLDSSSASGATPPRQMPDLIPNFSLPSIPKLVYFVIIAAFVLFALLRYGREIGAAINAFLRDLAEMLRRLFGGKPRTRGEPEEAFEEEVAEPVRPFSSYPDPFAMGTADRYTPQQLVNYTFEALQAWAHEQDCGRREEQTPLEFAMQIAGSHQQVGGPARNLAMLYNQVAYAPGAIGEESLDHLRRLWVALRS